VFSVSQVEAGGGLGRECWGGSVTVISIRLCDLLSAELKQEGARKGMLGWECHCY
jgi:hypothetical protein